MLAAMSKRYHISDVIDHTLLAQADMLSTSVSIWVLLWWLIQQFQLNIILF